jgi:hypothetical protein
MNIKFIVKVCVSLYYCKHESKLHHNPMFCWKNPKTTIKIYGISKQNLWFSIVRTSSSSLSSLPNFVSKNFFIFQNSPLLNHLKSHHHDQSQQEFKIQTNKVPWLVLILNALFIQNHKLILPPLTLPPLYFGFHPINPWKMTKMKWKYYISF